MCCQQRLNLLLNPLRQTVFAQPLDGLQRLLDLVIGVAGHEFGGRHAGLGFEATEAILSHAEYRGPTRCASVELVSPPVRRGFPLRLRRRSLPG